MDKDTEGLQAEVKVLKSQIKETLTDIREHLLNGAENPFQLDSERAPVVRQVSDDRPQTSHHQENTYVPPMPQYVPPMPQMVNQGQGFMPGNMGGPMFMPGNGGSPLMNFGPGATPPSSQYSPPAASVPTAVETAPRKEDYPAPGEAPPRSSVKREPAQPTSRAAQSGNGSHSGPESAARARPLARPVRRPAPASGQTQELDGGDQDLEDASELESPGAKTDLLTVALMTEWIEEGLRSIGRKRLRSVVELSYSLGTLGQQRKDVLLQLLSLEGTNGNTAKVSLRDNLRVLAALDALVKRADSDLSEAAVLSMFLNHREAPEGTWQP